MTVSKPDQSSGFFSFASFSPIGRIMSGGMATALTTIAFFSFAGMGDRAPARGRGTKVPAAWIASDHLSMVATILFAEKPQAANLAEGYSSDPL